MNFNTLGTAAAYSGPLIFSRLGIEIDKTFIPHPVALQQMRKGENDVAAVVFITSKPVDAFLRGQWEPGFKFLPVTYDARFEDYYLPASLEAVKYPNLIKPGERIPTIAVPTALVSYNWPFGSNRYQRVARFTDHLFSRIDKLQVAGFDAKWKTINLGATVPGLVRFPAAQEWLDRHVRKPAEAIRTVAICAALASLASAGALAQGTDDAHQKLRACMLPSYAERMACWRSLPARPPRDATAN